MPYLNYHHLRYFWVIATEGGLTRAARILNVSPSSLSVQLKALEEQLGQTLFEREGRSMRLTEAGRIALTYANTMFRSGDELLNTLKGLNPGGRQTLRIGAVATLSRNFQLELLKPYIDRRDVELIVRTGAFAELLAELDAHALDVVLANQPAPQDPETEWQNTLIAEQPVSIVGHPGLLEPGRAFRFPEDLAQVPIVLPGRGEGIRTAFDHMLKQAGVTPIILAEVDDMAMLRLIARESHSVTLAPPVVVADELAAGALVEYAQMTNVRETFYAITRLRRFENPLLRELTTPRA